ncbi:MAG: DUF4349 domain-containing protein [Nakamurella sp.]
MTAGQTRDSAARWRAGMMVIGVGMLALSACSASSDASSAMSSSADATMAEGMASAPTGGVAASSSSAASSSAASSSAAGGATAGSSVAGGATAGSSPVVPALDDRQIIRTADLQIRLPLPADTPDDRLAAAQGDALDAAVNKARSQVIGLGGFVADLQQAGGSASLVLRVPAAGYDALRAGAQEWGVVTSSSESAQDVTEAYTDVESRITSMKTSVDRIRTLLSQATAVGEVITIESELSRREADLEALEGRRQVLADQVSLGTVTVTLAAVRDEATDVAVAAKADRGGFLGGLDAGWSGLVAFLTGVGVVIGAVLPFVPLVVVAVIAAWWGRRVMRRRRDTTAPVARTEAPTPA